MWRQGCDGDGVARTGRCLEDQRSLINPEQEPEKASEKEKKGATLPDGKHARNLETHVVTDALESSN